MAKTFTLLLLYNKLSASIPVAHALTEKGLQVLAVDNSTDLAQYMRTREVDFVGLSVSHANAENVYGLLKNSPAKIPLFAFAEEDSRAAKDKLGASQAEMKIQGVASGYTIWKAISNIVKNKVGVQDGKIILSGMKDDIDLELGDVIIKKEDSATEANHVVLKTGDERFENLGKVYTEDMKKLMDCVRRFIGRPGSHEIQETDKLDPIDKMTAFIVGSHSEHGILLMGNSKGEHLTKDTIDSLLETIKKEFKGLPFKVEDVFQLDVKSSDICAWARQHSLFTFLYNNNTSFASLLKCGRLFPELVPTQQPEMRSMRLEYLPIQDIADFDIYLYFSRNDKLLPFIKKGEEAATKIRRMLDRGLHIVFIHEADRLRLHTACVQDFIQGALNFT